MKTTKLVIGLGILLGIGLLSQIVERSIDKPAIMQYVETNFVEDDTCEETFDFSDEEASTFFEWIGF